MSSMLKSSIMVTLLLASQVPSHAQAPRTWVSVSGDDANPCSRDAPCRTFAAAISKTTSAGKISVADSGDFGPVKITKSVSIVAEGAEGGIFAANADGITIDAAPGTSITLHGLFLEGARTGRQGIRVVSAGTVHVRKCLIRGFQAGGAIYVAPGGPRPKKVFISECALVKNTIGVRARAATLTGDADVVVDRVNIDSNTEFGVRAVGGAARVFMTNSIVTGSRTGLSATEGGTITSFGNNAIMNNGTNVAPTGTQLLQ